jgi:hypothetical protein
MPFAAAFSAPVSPESCSSRNASTCLRTPMDVSAMTYKFQCNHTSSITRWSMSPSTPSNESRSSIPASSSFASSIANGVRSIIVVDASRCTSGVRGSTLPPIESASLLIDEESTRVFPEVSIVVFERPDALDGERFRIGGVRSDSRGLGSRRPKPRSNLPIDGRVVT